MIQTHMLLPLIELFGDKRLARFSENPLFNDLPTGWTVSDLHAWWEVVDVLGQDMVKKWRSSLNRVRHLHTVSHASKDQVSQNALGPNVLACMQRVPLRIHQVEDTSMWIVCSGLLDVKVSIRSCPFGEMGQRYRPEARRNRCIVQHSPSCQRALCHETLINPLVAWLCFLLLHYGQFRSF